MSPSGDFYAVQELDMRKASFSNKIKTEEIISLCSILNNICDKYKNFNIPQRMLYLSHILFNMLHNDIFSSVFICVFFCFYLFLLLLYIMHYITLYVLCRGSYIRYITVILPCKYGFLHNCSRKEIYMDSWFNQPSRWEPGAGISSSIRLIFRFISAWRTRKPLKFTSEKRDEHCKYFQFWRQILACLQIQNFLEDVS